MEWLAAIGNIFSGAVGGGIFGVIGSVIGVWAKSKQAKTAFERKKAEWEHELKLQELQMQRDDRETENELALLQEQGASTARAASYDLDMTSNDTSRFAKNVRALFRPALTIWLWIMVPVVMWVLWYFLPGDTFGFVVTPALVEYIMVNVIFAASTATTWWFGDRALTPPELKHK